MSHSQKTKDFLSNLADKLRQLEFEAQEHYDALQHPLKEKEEAEWDRVIGSIMGAVNQTRRPDFIDPFDSFYGRPRLTLNERFQLIKFPDTDLT